VADHQDKETISLRPSWRKYGRSVLVRFSHSLLILVGAQLWLGAQSGGRDSVWEALPIGVVVLALVVDVAIRMNTVIRITPNDIAIQAPVILHKLVPRRDVGGLALRGVYSYPGAQIYGVLYDHNNRCLATLPEGVWDDSDLHRLQSAVYSPSQPIRYGTSAELGREFPGALTWARYAGWALAVLVVALILVGVALQGR